MSGDKHGTMLTTDLYLVIGIALCAISIPSILGALADGRSPRAAAVTVVVGAGLVLVAFSQAPGFYSVDETAWAFVRVAAHFLP